MLGTIWRKPELYHVPLEKTSVSGGGPKDKRQGLIFQEMLTKDMIWAIDSKVIHWYQMDVHWYIARGQHTYQVSVFIAAKEEPKSARHKFYIEFDVILVYSWDPDMLIKVSNTLNIQVKNKVATENFKS